MCGRYYVDDDTAKEIEKLVQNLDQSIKINRTGDIFPSQKAAVLRESETGLALDAMEWGFPKFDGKGLLINARSETALERKSFRDSIRQRRCIIPAKGFYEWNEKKEKFSYERKDMRVLFMAGCYKRYQTQDCFVILTTEANTSVSNVHDRMPLILHPDELESWILDDQVTEYLLHKIPPLLAVHAEYEQLSFFSES